MTNGPIIDTHVHLWDPRRLRYSWLDGIPALNRPFLPEDYRAACASVTVEKMVFVEGGCDTGQHLEEVRWISELARSEPRLSGVVAQVPLEMGTAVQSELATLARNPLVKGVRRLLQGERDPQFCLQPDFVKGVQMLAEFGFSFDVCIVPGQLPAIIELARRCPAVQFILDHAGKPGIRDGRREPWGTHLKSLAALPNVCCKLSGLATEADHATWTRDQLRPYLAHVVKCFGFDRVLFGSDWPVSTLATDYRRWVDTLQWALEAATPADWSKLFRDNAARWYRLKTQVKS